MPTSPVLTYQAAALHQRDLRAAAAHFRLVAKSQLATSSSPREVISLPPLITVWSLVPSLLISPRAASIAGVALALVAGLLLGPDGADAACIIHPGRLAPQSRLQISKGHWRPTPATIGLSNRGGCLCPLWFLDRCFRELSSSGRAAFQSAIFVKSRYQQTA
jgi:hypothetical protein